MNVYRAEDRGSARVRVDEQDLVGRYRERLLIKITIANRNSALSEFDLALSEHSIRDTSSIGRRRLVNFYLQYRGACEQFRWTHQEQAPSRELVELKSQLMTRPDEICLPAPPPVLFLIACHDEQIPLLLLRIAGCLIPDEVVASPTLRQVGLLLVRVQTRLSQFSGFV